MDDADRDTLMRMAAFEHVRGLSEAEQVMGNAKGNEGADTLAVLCGVFAQKEKLVRNERY